MNFKAFVKLNHLLSIFLNSLVVFYLYQFCKRRKNNVKAFLIMLIVVFILDQSIQIYYYSDSNFWKQLPFSLCEITYILSIFALALRSEKLFKITFFFSLGTVIAIVFPNNNGLTAFYSWEAIRHYTSHLTILSAQIFMYQEMGFRINKGDYKKVFRDLLILGALMMIFNEIFNTNFMFLNKQVEDHVISDIIGPWPNNLILFVLLGFPIMYITERIYFKLTKNERID